MMQDSFVFEMGRDARPASVPRLKPGTPPLYLLFRYADKVGFVTDLDDALERARNRAREDPGVQYIVMRAEVVVYAEPAPTVVKQINLSERADD